MKKLLAKLPYVLLGLLLVGFTFAVSLGVVT